MGAHAGFVEFHKIGFKIHSSNESFCFMNGPQCFVDLQLHLFPLENVF